MSTNSIAKEIRRLLARVETDNSTIMLIGSLLVDAKREVGHGRWLPFLEEAGIGDRIAQIYMRVSQKLSETPVEARADLLRLPLRELAKASSTPKAKGNQSLETKAPPPNANLRLILSFDGIDSEERGIIELSLPAEILDQCKALRRDDLKINRAIQKAIERTLAGRTKGKAAQVGFRGQDFKSKAELARWVESNFSMTRASVEAVLNLDKLRATYSGWNFTDEKLMEMGLKKLDERLGA
jgi:hypothetical protein